MRGLSAADASSKAREYLASPSLRHVPSIKISAMLWAAIARKAASGQRRLPTRGVVNDLRVISSLLPYCDVMFIDNEMRALLNEEPLATELGSYAKVYSPNNRDDFLSSLDELARSAPDDHLTMVKEVYGEERVRPYMDIFRPPAS
jgi:hypothetical protein